MRENKIVHVISALNFFGLSWYLIVNTEIPNYITVTVFWIVFGFIFIATTPVKEKNEGNSKSSSAL